MALLFRVAALAAACLISTGALAATIVLRGATVLDMTGAAPRRADVVVDGERIAAVLPQGQGRGDRIVDLTGKFLLPGFTDLHAHVLVHPVDARGHLGPRTDPALTLATLKLLLAYGVTTVRDVGAETEAAVEYRKELAARAIPGPRLFTCGRILDAGNVTSEPFARIDTAEEAREEVDRQARAGVDCIKAYASVGPDLLRAIIDEAHARDLPVLGHLLSTSWKDAVDLGIDGIEHAAPWTNELIGRNLERDLFGRVEWLERIDAASTRVQELIASLARRRVPVDLTLIAMHTKLYGDSDRWQHNPDLALAPPRMVAGFRAGAFTRSWTKGQYARAHAAWPDLLAWVRALYDGGVILTAGTDTPNPWIVPGASLHDELLLLEEAGIPRAEVLRIATRNAAIALHRESEMGTIEPGKSADLVALSKDPLADLHNTREIQLVMQRGREVDRAALLPRR
ncbi:MAG: amidohydrolase family protein [Myxococcales bacterium]